MEDNYSIDEILSAVDDLQNFKSSKIGVIGTQSTINSNSYMNQFLKLSLPNYLHWQSLKNVRNFLGLIYL